MNKTDFNKIVLARIDAIMQTLTVKAVEYANDDDRFHNFKEAAIIGHTTPEKALKGMLLKHIVSVFNMIDNKIIITEPLINEKIGDCINYLILLEGIFRE